MIFFDFVFYILNKKIDNYYTDIFTSFYIYLTISFVLQLFLLLLLNGAKTELNYFFPLMFLIGILSSNIEKKRYTVEKIDQLDKKWFKLSKIKKNFFFSLIVILGLFMSLYNFGILPDLIIKNY